MVLTAKSIANVVQLWAPADIIMLWHSFGGSKRKSTNTGWFPVGNSTSWYNARLCPVICSFLYHDFSGVVNTTKQMTALDLEPLDTPMALNNELYKKTLDTLGILHTSILCYKQGAQGHRLELSLWIHIHFPGPLHLLLLEQSGASQYKASIPWAGSLPSWVQLEGLLCCTIKNQF